MPRRRCIINKMKIKVIATGSSKFERSIRRWGVSFLIGEDALFDTFGDPDVFLNNMRKFNVDSGKIRHIILSHDDWDHVSGLWTLLPALTDVTVYICPGFSREVRDRISSFGVNMIETDKSVTIKDGIYTTGQLYGESDARKIFEQSVVIKTDEGLAVICGCAHPGVDNIVKKAGENFSSKVDLLMGGFHLKDNADEVNAKAIENLKKAGVRRVMPMHCTGERAVALMRATFGSGFRWLQEGDVVKL